MGLRPRITSEDIILLGGIGVTGEYARGGERMNPVVSIDVAHTPIIQCLDENDVLYILLNPIISHQAKKSSLRKVKTDAFDAYQLCTLYYKEDFEPYKMRGIQLLNLRNLSRQQEIVTNMYVEAKLQFHTNLDQIFPNYRKVFGDFFRKYLYRY